MRRFLLLAAVLCASPALAQVIYQPVSVQHPGFSYAGKNPALIAHGLRVAALKQLAISRNIIVILPSGKILRPSDPAALEPAVYSDSLPYVDLAPLGYTAADATNEKSASLPRYIRKADLLARARPINGTLTATLDDASPPSSVGSEEQPEPPTTTPTTHSPQPQSPPNLAQGEIRLSPARQSTR